MSQSSCDYTQLNGFKYSKWLNISIWPINGTLTGTTTQDQNWPKSNSNEGVLQILQSPRTVVSPSDTVYCPIRTLIGRKILLLCRNSVDVFYSPSQLGRYLAELRNTLVWVKWNPFKLLKYLPNPSTMNRM